MLLLFWQDKVFGAGYPSLPTMTVEEFYEQNYGNLQPPETFVKINNNNNNNNGELCAQARLGIRDQSTQHKTHHV